MELSRFVSHIEAVLSALSVQDTGEKGGKYMKSKIKYTDESLGKLRIEAKKHNTQYQKMIRRLLDLYAAHYKQPPQTNQD